MYGESIASNTVQYAPSVNEFRLMTTKLNKSESETLDFNKIENAVSDYASIVLIYEGNGSINNINVTEGDCLLIPKNINILTIKSNENCGLSVARCFTPKI